MATAEIDLEALRTETRRLIDRYINEVVLAYDLCPWAAPALQQKRIEVSVITALFEGNAGFARAAEASFQVSSLVPDHIDLLLVVLPRLRASRLQLDEVLRQVRGCADENGERSFAWAAFHPDASADIASPERFIPYLRRSPDPLLQGVRASVLAQIESNQESGTSFLDLRKINLSADPAMQTPALRTRIARQNLQTVLHKGLEELEERLADIHRDRQQTHRRLGLHV